MVMRVEVDRRDEFVAGFGRVALGAAGLLFATGVWGSYAQVGSLNSFVSTGYGRLVLAKVAGFAVMGALGWMNRQRLRSAVVNAQRTMRFEVIAALVVLGVTASLVGSVPARAGLREPFYTRVETPTMAIDVTVLPATVGLNTMHLYFYDASGNPDGVDVATASISIRDIPARRIQLLPITGDHFSAAGFALPMKGVWTLTLKHGPPRKSRHIYLGGTRQMSPVESGTPSAPWHRIGYVGRYRKQACRGVVVLIVALAAAIGVTRPAVAHSGKGTISIASAEMTGPLTIRYQVVITFNR